MAQNWHFWSIWDRPCRLFRCPVGGSVGGVGARAVSRKTPNYFIYVGDGVVSSVNVDDGVLKTEAPAGCAGRQLVPTSLLCKVPNDDEDCHNYLSESDDYKFDKDVSMLLT